MGEVVYLSDHASKDLSPEGREYWLQEAANSEILIEDIDEQRSRLLARRAYALQMLGMLH